MNTRFIEHQHQAAFFDFWRAYAPTKGLEASLCHSVPNAAKRSAKLAAYMKAEGLTPGILDVNLDVARGGFFGLKLEFKRPGAQPSKEQAAVIASLRKQGYNVLIAWSIDEAVRAVTAYLRQPPTKVA